MPLPSPASPISETPKTDQAPASVGGHAQLLHEIFAATAQRFPQNIALECEGRQWTYWQVKQFSNQFAQTLAAKGIAPGDRVAIWLPRSEQMHIASLAILQAGATYVPLDPEYPADRVAYVLENCEARALVTSPELAAKIVGFTGIVIPLEVNSLTAISLETLSENFVAPSSTLPSDLAYIIYTSGSTGRPKGVMIEHRSIVNLVEAEVSLFNVQPTDRVFQGFSIAFDASLEEIWLAFRSGAALVVGTHADVHAGPELAAILAAKKISVWSTVPTLLSMLSDEIPTLRLLILGGEQCPDDLVTRWSRPGRRMVNTYGPTEATVIATFADVFPGQKVTIGQAVPTYTAYILDENLQPLPVWSPGELHLGGIGLARGYVALPEQTTQKFIPNPFAATELAADPLRPAASVARLYKTGDLCRWNDAGEIEFHGRIDSQVKIRGFRVELSEIEAVLLQAPGVLASAVTLREDIPGIQQLVGYVIARESVFTSEEAVRAFAQSRLPVYMVPALVEVVADFPTLPSGKIDRSRLPAPQPRATANRSAVPLGQLTPTAQKLLAIWQTLFAPAEVQLDDNFFLTLGGHSLLAAKLVTLLRQDAQFQRISMLDVYQHPTLRELAQRFEPAEATKPNVLAVDAPNIHKRRFQAVTTLRFTLCGVAQTIALYFVLGFFSLQWLAPYLAYTWFHEDYFTVLESLLGGVAALVAIYPVMLVVTILAKWVILGRIRPGSYPLWGWFYFRWWLANSIVSAVPIRYLAGTPLLAIYYRFLGAKIGSNVYLGTDTLGAYDLIEIGDDCSIASDAMLEGYSVEDGRLHIGGVKLGAGCYVGTRAVLREEVQLGAGARLEDMSMLPRGTIVPAGETWRGSPARRDAAAKEYNAPLESDQIPSLSCRFWFGVAHALGVLTFPVLAIAALFPGMVLMNYLNAIDDWYYYLVLSPLVALSFVVFLCLEITVVKWLLLGRVRAGTYPVHSWFYWRKWFVDQLLELSIDVIGPLYSTVYLAPWYRLLGAKIGKRAEISTASFISPDLLEIDDESFIADIVSLGAARVERGQMTVAGNRVGKRSFIGNSALLPPGAVIGDNCLIGCLSVPPPGFEQGVKNDTSWVGSPAIFLPQRQEAGEFSNETTFAPTRSLVLQRALIEFCRVLFPSSAFIALTNILLSYIAIHRAEITLSHLIMVFPLLYGSCAVLAVLTVVLLKWLIVGRYRPNEQPLWSHFVWRSELVTGLHDYLATPFLADALRGTPLLAWYFRLLGAKVGKRVFMDTTQLTEFDLVEIGDEACLNSDATLQTHLFEDRVMKMSWVKIGPRCTIGSQTLVLYDTEMAEGALLGDLSLLMKGETLPAWTEWQGIPASAVPETKTPVI